MRTAGIAGFSGQLFALENLESQEHWWKIWGALLDVVSQGRIIGIVVSNPAITWGKQGLTGPGSASTLRSAPGSF